MAGVLKSTPYRERFPRDMFVAKVKAEATVVTERPEPAAPIRAKGVVNH
jgi:hypothetical protein